MVKQAGAAARRKLVKVLQPSYWPVHNFLDLRRVVDRQAPTGRVLYGSPGFAPKRAG